MVPQLSKRPKRGKPKHIKRKVLLLGDGAVGKTSLIRKFVIDKFDDKYIATIGTKVTKKELELQYDGKTIYVTLMIWDVLGQRDYKSVQSASFKGADGVILVCDLTRKETLLSLEEYWLEIIRSNISRLRLVFVGNKCDLLEKAQFSLDDLQAVASNYNTVSFASSAKTGEGVEKLFLALGNKLLDIEEEDAGKEQMVIADQTEEMTLVAATDRIINDFCDNFGNLELAMPVIRRQFSEAGVDIRNPTKTGLLKIIDRLAEVERGYKDTATIQNNRTKRRLLVQKVKG